MVADVALDHLEGEVGVARSLADEGQTRAVRLGRLPQREVLAGDVVFESQRRPPLDEALLRPRLPPRLQPGSRAATGLRTALRAAG